MNIRCGRVSVVVLVPLFISFCSSSTRGIIVFCAGDSITAAAYPHFLQNMLNTNGIRARVINHGRSGNTSREYLGFLMKNQKKLSRELPDFILLQLGTNDVRIDSDSTPGEAFRANLNKILDIFRTFHNRNGKNAVILLATIPPVPKGVGSPFSERSRERVSAEINPLIREICQKEKILLVDNYSLFVSAPELLPDVHPTPEGYKRLARNWFEALKPLL